MKVLHPLSIRLVSHNIRYATENLAKGEEKWECRKSGLLNELNFNTLHSGESIICLQEVLRQQLIDILSSLNRETDAWAYVGIGRDDGREAGEYSPILYRPAIWVLKIQRTIWLSETPDRPSKGWDAGSPRILTIAVFEHRMSGRSVVIMNTHLDDRGSKSRLEAAKIILEQIGLFAEAGRSKYRPVILAGDFNSEPHQEAYSEMTSAASPMRDLRSLISDDRRYGDSNTFSGFDPETTRRKRIDFIFVNDRAFGVGVDQASDRSPGELWSINGYAVLPNVFEDGIYISDHQAVIGDLSLM